MPRPRKPRPVRVPPNRNPAAPPNEHQHALYEAAVARRLQWDNLLWQVPVLSFTAQAFLFTVALSAGNDSWARIIASLLSLVIALLSILLMARHRQGEITDAHWLEDFEHQVMEAGDWGLHGDPFKRVRAKETLNVHPLLERAIPLWPMFGVWVGGLALFGVAAIVVIARTIYGVLV